MKSLTPEQYQALKRLYHDNTSKELAVDRSFCVDLSRVGADRSDSILWLQSYFGALQAALQKIVELEAGIDKVLEDIRLGIS